jgi:hypothetical protein
MIDLDRMMTRLPRQAADAVLGMLRLRSKTLAKHLRETWGSPAGMNGSLVAEPFLEGAFPWLLLKDGWSGLEQGIFDPRTIDVLREVSFPPYVHQVLAWKQLAGQRVGSVIVSSGTGSGKTECFLAPILDRLVRLSDCGKRPLVGVRALMLYPLNALISSQEKRLERWFTPFGGALRYCLYNGETPTSVRNELRADRPWRVADRTSLRAAPPPVLVTNATMLEYMLIRQADTPILAQSQGTLDYIVLDEAHSYTGAQAAEVSLLLRRVALAFGRTPDQIRYVATSATIGGERADFELRRFLEELSGAPGEAIHVVQGHRAPLPPEPPDLRASISLPLDLTKMDARESGRLLAASEALRRTREDLRSGRLLSWREWSERATTVTEGVIDSTKFLVEAARAKDPHSDPVMAAIGADSVLPNRIHLFHRTIGGLWACINPACPQRLVSGADSDWPYGAVFDDSREHCPHCQSLVLEWVCCKLCGDGALRAEEFETGSRVGSWSEGDDEDEFEQTLERDDRSNTPDGEETEATGAVTASIVVSRRYLSLPVKSGSPTLQVELATGCCDGNLEKAITFSASIDVSCCPACAKVPDRTDPRQGALRSAVAGAPFLLSQITPGFLADLSPELDSAEVLPFDGRRVITFTDARQGTARHAANLQIASERSFIRGFLYHFVQESPRVDTEKVTKLDDQIARLRTFPNDPVFAAMAVEKEKERTRLLGAGAKPWTELVGRLSRHSTVEHFLRPLWVSRDNRFADTERLAEFLLYREAMRRPVRSNSAETLGLFRFQLPEIDDSDQKAPTAARAAGLSDAEWRDLLRLVVTHFLRTNVALDFPRWWLNWIDRRQSHIEVIPWQAGVRSEQYVRFWPNPYGRPTRVVSLLFQALRRDRNSAADRDRVAEICEETRRALSRYMAASGNGSRMRLGELSVGKIENAYWCPTTRRILDTTLRGLSPYHVDGVYLMALPIIMPRLPNPWRRDEHGVSESEDSIDSWLASDANICTLREAGMWGDQQDRAAKLVPWLRAAEHSAQQSSTTLRRYEKDFAAGRINVLGCSTTMEMGVDIGGVEAVLNTNAPPEVANYRQRVGRAGRRGQPIAVGLTLCKDRPLDRMAISNPLDYLTRPVRTPRVSLDSPTIATRHAAALLLARFLRGLGSELHKLTNGAFFALGPDVESRESGPSPATGFQTWLDRALEDPSVAQELKALLRGTPVIPSTDLIEILRGRIDRIGFEIQAEWDALAGTGSETSKGDVEFAPAKRARELQRVRLERGHLLGELAGRGFLPSYGFPTDVVQFVTETANERATKNTSSQEEGGGRELSFGRGYPSRSREIGIYEYAPGRSIVVDGVVRESAGVTLNWQRPVSQEGLREIQSLRSMWSCRKCGALSSRPSALDEVACSECGSNDQASRPYLSPAGFSVDIRFHVHDDPSDLGGGRPVDPWVSTRNAPWRALPDPRVGRVRASSDGTVFWFNPGKHGYGYAVCFHCGRAEAETDEKGGSGLSGHRPLRGVPLAIDGEMCTGAPEFSPFAVQRHLALGHEIRTDLCEIQLYDCSSQAAALTIALALREAISRRLGIDADEMGFASPAAPNALGLGRENWSSVIFDRASGGAGFSATTAVDPVAVLREARSMLDCSLAGRCGDLSAKRACPRCVLGPDAQHAADDTDRATAFALLNATLARLDLPMEHQLFGPATAYEPASLAVALEECMSNPSAELVVMLHGEPSEWDFDAWPASATVERLGARGRNITVEVERAVLETADAVTRRRLALWIERCRGRLAYTSSTDVEMLALVVSEDRAIGWRSSDRNAYVIGPAWASTSSAPIVRGNPGDRHAAETLDSRSLLVERIKETIFEVHSELNGSVTSFGPKLRSLLIAGNESLASALAGPFTELCYSDRYLFSPLAVRLVAELLGGFANSATRLEINTLEQRRDYRKPPMGKYLNNDWQDMAARNRVLEHLIEKISPSAKVNLYRDLPHRRRLDFKTERSSGTIFFDQGVGSWRTSNSVPFDPMASFTDQLRAASVPFAIVNGPDGTFVASRLD